MKKIMDCLFACVMILGAICPAIMFAFFGTKMISMGFIFDGILIYGCALIAVYCSYLMFNIAMSAMSADHD
jgi:hypothetical protein